MNELDEIMSDTNEKHEPRITQPLNDLPPLEPGYIRLINIKDVPIEEVQDVIESQEETPEPEPIIIEAKPTGARRKILLFAVPSVVIVVAVAVILTTILVIAPLLAFFTPANITIIPVSQTVTAQLSVNVMTQNADPTKNQIPGRPLSSGVISQQKTVAATGRGHTDATAARGVITFYNASESVQTIPSGTLLTSASGVEIVTDQDVSVPGAVLPNFGQASGPAHAVNPGPSGDLDAGAISGHCCRADMQAVSGAFSGGADARDFTVVSQQDIDSGSQSLRTALEQSARANIQAQAKGGETVLSASCSTATESTVSAGGEAAQTVVTVDETCAAVAYATTSLYTLSKQAVTGKAGPGLLLSGDIQTQVKQSGNDSLQVTASGLYFADVTQAELHKLSQQIAGKSREEATKILLSAPGVWRVQGLPDTLPGDAARVRLMVLYSA